MKTIAEQIQAALALRKEKFAALEAVNEKAMTESRVFSDEETNEFDALKGEITEIDAQIDRLKDMETMAGKNAEPYTPAPAPAAAAATVVVATGDETKAFGQGTGVEVGMNQIGRASCRERV